MKIKSGLINKLAAQHKQLGVDASIKIIDAIDASIERLGLSADIAPIGKLAVAVELGDFLIQRFMADGVLVDDMSTAVDQFVMDFFKTLTDDAALADQIAKDFSKGFHDAGLVTDIQVVAFFKGLSETIASTDSVAWLVEKPLEEVPGLEDYVALLTKKAAEEVVGTSDSIDQFEVTKGLAHATAIGSHVATSLSKPLQDTAALTDTLTLLTEKLFLDASSVGDSNALTVGKPTADVSHITDTLHIQTTFARALTDAYGVSDEFDKVLNKQPTDTTVSVDDMALLSQGYVNDAFYFADDYIGTSRTA